jgi:putative thioredoxin
MAIDVTDATFQAEVIERSSTVPVVVDLWAPWCGPCRQLTPIIEKVIAETNGAVALTKVNVDENPQVSQAFQVQGIPAVFALKDGKVIDTFTGARPEAEVKAFVDGLMPSPEDLEIDRLLAIGDEPSLQAILELRPDHHDATVALAELFVESERSEQALELLGRIPETAEVRRVAALARTGGVDETVDVAEKLDDLLSWAKDDDEARQEFIDLLEVLGPDDDRTAEYRKKLTSALY